MTDYFNMAFVNIVQILYKIACYGVQNASHVKNKRNEEIDKSSASVLYIF